MTAGCLLTKVEDRVVSVSSYSLSLALPVTQPPSIWEAYLAQPWPVQCRWTLLVDL